MKPTALVVTTVHWPDDTRIRERLIRTLSQDFSVVYAAKSSGPTDRSGLEYYELRGGRLRRSLEALRLALRSRWDVLILHDPETIPIGVLARLFKRKPVVFDVHEDYPAITRTREWVPASMRASLALAIRAALKVAERVLTITLAEPGYRSLFIGDHPVFPNFPDTTRFPPVQQERRDEVVYLGDATLARGVDVAVEACSRLGIPLRLIGRITPEVKEHFSANRTGLVVEGSLPNPEALRLVSGSAVGLVPLRDIPNYRHSQPTKLLEYLALGVPVVASDLSGTRDMVSGLAAVSLVPAGDVEAMTAAISEALTGTAREAATAQADTVRERFQWPAQEVRDFYVSLLNP